jgi:hypothetical protein
MFIFTIIIIIIIIIMSELWYSLLWFRVCYNTLIRSLAEIVRMLYCTVAKRGKHWIYN